MSVTKMAQTNGLNAYWVHVSCQQDLVTTLLVRTPYHSKGTISKWFNNEYIDCKHRVCDPCRVPVYPSAVFYWVICLLWLNKVFCIWLQYSSNSSFSDLEQKHTSLKYFRAYFSNCRSKFEIDQSLIEAVRPGKENINFRSRMYIVSVSGTRLSAIFDYLANWRPLYVLNLWIHKRELLLSNSDKSCDKIDSSMNIKLALGYKVNLSTINFIYGSIDKQTTHMPYRYPKTGQSK